MQRYADRALMGAAAARAAADTVRDLLSVRATINIIFAAAPSQNEFLAALSEQTVDWQRINAFHMDEYLGLDSHSPQSFAAYLNQHLFEKVAFNQVCYLDGAATDPDAECRRYGALLKQFPSDIVCMGIGENNHLAFNDPPVADFNDRETVRIVSLDPACRQQQVNDGCFLSLAAVPERALTLTIPALLDSRHIICVVPGERKATAVYHTLKSLVTEKYPSTILQTHPSVQLFLDEDSAHYT